MAKIEVCSLNISHISGNQPTGKCILDNKRILRHIVFYVGIFVVALLLFLFVCIIMKRKKLVHKVVNAYAVNTLAILLINSIWHVATFSNGLFGRKTVFVSLPSDGEVFVKSLTGAFILGMPFSLALLINAMQSDLFRIHRMVSGVSNDGSFEETKTPEKNFHRDMLKSAKNRICYISKKAKATILISSNWILPLLISLLCFVDKACIKACVCPNGYLYQNDSDQSLHQPCDCTECNLMWTPISKKLIITFAIICVILFCINVVLLIRSVFKFREFVRTHKKQTNSKRKFYQQNAPVTSRTVNETIRLSVKGVSDRGGNSRITDEEKMFTMLTHVNYDVSLDAVTIHSSNRHLSSQNENAEDDVQQGTKKSTIDDVRCNDKKQGKNSNLVGNSDYETVSFSNVFLLVRLKKNLKFLSLILLLFFLGMGGGIMMTLILSYHHDYVDNFDILLVVVLPSVMCQAISALILCNTTSDLKHAVLYPTRRLFYACRTVHYAKR